MAAPGSTPQRPTTHASMIPSEWPAQATDLVVDTIAKVHDKTTKPAIIGSRGLVYGLLGAIVGTVAFVLTLILIVRLWDNYMPGPVWVIYAIFFAAFSLGGVLALRKANAPAPTDEVV